eukprot:CAMPEP_0169212012 /NCGR_PEP_ID=MMETSP1016-20121227/16058_1 /TAXON_ID=342587 /ORGANISM="Karlodinium micrum, Strain CCMP2283" /LENGTH=50 /DNA_ID=CAMNT_0009289665 /DNA_START=117 /DNA_END=266 /DNA_ORIENTATION=-
MAGRRDSWTHAEHRQAVRGHTKIDADASRQVGQDKRKQENSQGSEFPADA